MSELFTGGELDAILCYSVTSAEGWTIIFFLLALFIILLGYGLSRQFEMKEIFFTSSTVIFSLATIFFISNNIVGCELLSEQNYIIVVIIFVASIINVLFNKPENS